MSAHEQMRRMLDELMGTCRNGEDGRNKMTHFSSARVCKSFLLDCCPHEILAATRCDLGECPKMHDVALKADYENSSRRDEYNFEMEALTQLKNFIAESERRTQIAKVRLAHTQENLIAEEAIKQDKLRQLDEKINETLARTEVLGASGDVQGSLKLMEEVDALKKEKSKFEEESKNTSVNQQQNLRVCEVCSSYLGFSDSDKRLADHFNGKLHLGFLAIREKLKELEDRIQERHINLILEKEFKTKSCNQRSRSQSPKSEHRHRHHRSHSKSCKHDHKHRHRSKHEKSHSSSRHKSGSHSREEKNLLQT